MLCLAWTLNLLFQTPVSTLFKAKTLRSLNMLFQTPVSKRFKAKTVRFKGSFGMSKKVMCFKPVSKRFKPPRSSVFLAFCGRFKPVSNPCMRACLKNARLFQTPYFCQKENLKTAEMTVATAATGVAAAAAAAATAAAAAAAATPAGGSHTIWVLVPPQGRIHCGTL